MTKATLRANGANVVVQAFGEALFVPGAPAHRFTEEFSIAVKRWSRAAAPTNKRPRWSHYGLPLKQTIEASRPRFYKRSGGARLFAAVGSSSPHAYYVDQGTHSFFAKILPPWTHGGASLYEHTWKRPVSRGDGEVTWEEVGQIHVSGQRAQHFFEKGLTRAFATVLRQSGAGETTRLLSEATLREAEGTLGFLGNTPNDSAFQQQLEQWRLWRDEAWNSGRILGFNNGLGNPEWVRRLHRDRSRGLAKEARQRESRAAARAKAAARKQKSRERLRALGIKEKRYDKVKAPVRLTREQVEEARQAKAIQAERVRFVSTLTGKYPAASGYNVTNIHFVTVDGISYWTATVVSPNGTSRPVNSKIKF